MRFIAFGRVHQSGRVEVTIVILDKFGDRAFFHGYKILSILADSATSFASGQVSVTDYLMFGNAALAHAVGGALKARAEQHRDPTHIDHVWIRMQAGDTGSAEISVNTSSRRNLVAGFDPRVRVGMISSTWEELPLPVFEPFPRFDYAEQERNVNVFYEHYEREALEELLIATTRRAHLLEAWGEPYRNPRHPGLHQIHSRRASCAVAEDIRFHDGALRFYFPEDKTSTLFLFKFCGQP